MTSLILCSMICVFTFSMLPGTLSADGIHEKAEGEAKSYSTSVEPEAEDYGDINIIGFDQTSINAFKENSLHFSEANGKPDAVIKDLKEQEPLEESKSHRMCEARVPWSSTDDWRLVLSRPVYTFSAFFDDREAVNGPLVRVTALGLQRSHVRVEEMYCQFATHTLRNRSISCEAGYSKIYPSTAHADEYTAHWLECPYPQTLIAKYGYPKNISIVGRSCEQSSYSLEIKYKKKQRSGFGLCLPSIYNEDDGIGVAEWIILHKLLGYRSIIMYNAHGHVTSQSKIGKVLNLYKKGYDKNISIQLVSWNYPHKKSFYFAQHSVINDCLYRMSMDHTHVTVCDKDEVVIPLKHRTIPDFVKSIESDNFGAYMTQHVMFNTDEANVMSGEIAEAISAQGIKDVEALHLTTLKYTSRMSKPYPDKKTRSKTIYKVDRTISADVHFPKYMVEGFQEVLVPPNEAVVYHYRKPPNHKWLNAGFIVNHTRITMFQDQLLAEVTALVKEAGIIV